MHWAGMNSGMTGSHQVGENPGSRKLSKQIYTGGSLPINHTPPRAIKTTLTASKTNIEFELLAYQLYLNLCLLEGNIERNNVQYRKIKYL